MIIRHKGKASESLLKKILEVLERRQCTSRYPLEWIMQMLLLRTPTITLVRSAFNCSTVQPHQGSI